MNGVSQQTNTLRSDCPCCLARATFGPRRITGQYWVIRCSKCGYYSHEPLPRITKKVIYLDQCFLSHVLSAKEPRWKAMCDRVRLLFWLDLVICPYSRVHREESLLAKYSRDALKTLYRELSGGVKFLLPDEIEQKQLHEALRCYLGQAEMPDEWRKPRPWEEFCKQDPHTWLNGLRFYADFPANSAVVKWLQDSKARLHSALEAVAESWQDEDTQKFDDDVKREALAYGKTLMAGYRELADGPKAIESMLSGISEELLEQYRVTVRPGLFNPRTPPGNQPGVRLVHSLAVEVHRARPREADPVSVVETFFESDVALAVPFQFISSHLLAVIAGQVRKSNRAAKPGDSNDVSAIAHYVPYCDAMFLDNEFRELASQGNVDVPERYSVRLFSATTADDFVEYLNDLLHNMPCEHREALRLVHPELAHVPLLNPPNNAE